MRRVVILAAVAAFLTTPAWAGQISDPEFLFNQSLVIDGDTLNGAATIYSDPFEISWGDTCGIQYQAWSTTGGVSYTISLEVAAHDFELLTSNAETATGSPVVLEITSATEGYISQFSVGDSVYIDDSADADAETMILTAVSASANTVSGTIVANYSAGSSIKLLYTEPEAGATVIAAETDEVPHYAAVAIPLAGWARVKVVGGGANSADTKVVVRWLEQ